MKKTTMILCAIFFAAFVLHPETIANVTSHKDLTLTIDRGASDGVRPEMKGIVKAVYKDPSGEYPMNIGVFTVRKVYERTADVVIEIGKGLNVADARYVVFEQDLVAGNLKNEIPAKVMENADWHLEQGDKAADAGNAKSALEHYQKALAMEPKNLVAQEKCSEMKKKIASADRNVKFEEYLKKADANYEKNNVKFAFLYLIEALRMFPEGKADVKDRLVMMANEYPQELQAILKEKGNELKDIRTQIDSMLEKAPEPEAEPAQAVTKKKESAYGEDFLRKIEGKAEKISQNEKGFWEALFAKNITMIYVPAGEFTIGSPENEGDADEHPAHKVFVAGYWIGKTEVTFEQYDRFCAETGREKSEDESWGREKRPAIYVSWNDAGDFCAWLAKKTGLKFRLPSEAEWEKAARDRYPWGSAAPDSGLANFNKDSMQTSPVGSFPQGASSYDVLDMAGNVWEWVADWYDPGFYRNSPRENPRGPAVGSERVVRGGSWENKSDLIRAANRTSENPDSKLNILGFRLAMDGD